MSDTHTLPGVFAAAARELIGKLKEGEAAFRETRAPEGIHSMRTAARRLRSALRFLGSHLSPADRKTLKLRLRTFMRVLGPVRDLHVLIEAVQATAELPAEDARSLCETAEERGEHPSEQALAYLDGEE